MSATAGADPAGPAGARCDDDKTPGLLYCQVFSPAMGVDIPVQIKPPQGARGALYLLDGLRADSAQNAWTWERGNSALTFMNDPIGLVMPVGGQSSFYSDWLRPSTSTNGQVITYRWETFLTRELPGYLEQYFGIDPHRNFVAGASMGGTAALNLAAYHRDQFIGVASFSGYLSTTRPGGVPTIAGAMLDAGAFNAFDMWGEPSNPLWARHDPILNIPLLKGLPTFVTAGNGQPGEFDVNDTTFEQGTQISASGLEFIAMLNAQWFQEEAVRQDFSTLQLTIRPEGSHRFSYWHHELSLLRGEILRILA